MDIYQENILKSIEIMIEEKTKQLKFDYTITGKVLSYDDTTKVYTVLYDDSELLLKARDGLILSINDIVYIRVIQGNFSEKFIDCKKP